MRVPMASGGIGDQYLYFYAVDSTDFTTPETGLTGFTVVISRNGSSPTTMSTPTIAQVNSGVMPGVYKLLLDEDITLAAGHDEEEMVLHISCAGMAPVVTTIEIFRPKITAGNTLAVTSGGDVANVDLVDVCTTNTDMRGTNNAALATDLATLISNVATMAGIVNTIAADTTTDLPALIAVTDAVCDSILAMIDNPRGEPGSGAIPATVDMATKIDYLFKLARNKKDSNGSFMQIYSDDGVTPDHKQTTTESAGVVTIGEMAAP